MNKALVIVIGSTLLLANCSKVAEANKDPSAIDRKSKLKQVVLYTTSKLALTKKDQDCLARNVFYEAGNQSDVGKLAVAQITVNRMETGRWGHKVCDVVYSESQFSWTRDRKKKWAEPKGELWAQAKVTVQQIQAGYRIKDLEGSLSYHARYISKPKWAKVQEPVKMIGEHIFYASVDTGRF